MDIVQVMQASTGTLRALHEQVGGVEKVEDVVEELREEMAKVDEIGNVTTEVTPDVDEEELDGELLDMEAQEQSTREDRDEEMTRKKLAELERFEKGTAEGQSRGSGEKGTSSDFDLEQSMKRLSQISIHDASSKPEGATQDEHHPVRAK